MQAQVVQLAVMSGARGSDEALADEESVASEEDLPYCYVESCTCEGCSRQSWKKAAVWGWTEAECKEQLRAHITMSSLHNLSSADASVVLDSVQLVPASADVPRPAKKPRAQPRAVGAPADLTAAPRTPVQGPLAVAHRGKAMPVLAPRQRPENVVISRVTLDALIDSCTRTQRALQNAQRLSMAAASAFAEEQTIVCDAKMQLEQLKRAQ